LPTYEYKCTSCGHRYETREGFDAPARQPCPNCGETAKRLLFPPPIVFKGSGFYITDSRKGSQATLADAPAGSSGSSIDTTKSNGSTSSSSSEGTTPAPASSGNDNT
jgi:putative FmdB family regulatory protein